MGSTRPRTASLFVFILAVAIGLALSIHGMPASGATALALGSLAAVVGVVGAWQANRRAMLLSPLALSTGGSALLFAVFAGAAVAVAVAGADGEYLLGAAIGSFGFAACIAWLARSRR